MRPAKLKILGKPFKVQWLADGLDPDLVGECDSDGQVIKVRDGQPLEQEMDTLIHEVCHAIDEAMGANMKEAQVKKLATGLLAVLKDNDPELLDYLTLKPCVTCGAPERLKTISYCRKCHLKRVVAWQKAHPEAVRKWRRRRLYNLSEEQYQAMLTSQDGCCANIGCGRKAENIDHDHATGKVRGILCGSCNRALGMVADSSERLEGLIRYLDDHKPKSQE